MAPNFEITMYLAQATGSCIATDSVFRWRELSVATGRGIQIATPLRQLRTCMERAEFVFPYDVQEICMLAERGVLRGYPKIMRKIMRYLPAHSVNAPKSNVEANLLNSIVYTTLRCLLLRNPVLACRKRTYRVFGQPAAFRTTQSIGSY